MGLQYLWMWIAAFLSLVVYVFLALVVKRIIIIDGYRIHLPTAQTRSISPPDSSGSQPQRDEGAIAFRMLL